YKLISIIGKGSFAVVYKGNKENTFIMPNVIAIKSIIKERLTNKKLTDNLRLEINILMKIRHQHIVQLYGIEPSEKTINLLMEYCACGDLSIYMKKHFMKKDKSPLIGPWKGFNEYIVLDFLFQLASALKYMKEKNVVHRDLKPQNILLTHDPNRRLHPIPRPTFSSPNSYSLVYLPFLKLADFGFARSLTSTNLASTLCGSPLYMAPEILNCKTYTANVDLWSLGTILY
ncbi:kinase-like protein, partial [Anaeromyces robustus]